MERNCHCQKCYTYVKKMHIKTGEFSEENRELQACSFQNWYSNYEKITIPSKCIEIPKEVVDYLQEDMIILPKECPIANSSSCSGYDDEDTETVTIPEFPEFSKSITDAIREFSGSVFIKTNWRSPKDAFWITAGQTLKVKDITDAYQLLKASSVIKSDLTNRDVPKCDDCSRFSNEYVLVLKKWQDIHPGTEFRCFVQERNLIAISPRDWPSFNKYILGQRRDIVNDIVSLFKEHIKFTFPLSSFVFDVIRTSKDCVLLLDFSPFREGFTDSLAFSWDTLKKENLKELEGNGEDQEEDTPEFRYLSEDCGIQPNQRNNYGISHDILEFFSDPNAFENIPNNLIDVLQHIGGTEQQNL